MAKRIRKPDVLIIGAALAGSVLANQLKKRGLNVILAERNAEPRKIFKGEYLQPAVVEYLQSIGFGSIFRASSVAAVKELRFRDLDENNNVISDLLMKYPRGKSARSIHHYDLLKSLFRLNRTNLGENFWSACTVTPTNLDSPNFLRQPEFRLESNGREPLTIRPRWVVGCDGRASSVKKWMGLGEANSERDQHVTLGAGREFIMGMELTQAAPKMDRYEVIRTAGRGTLAAFSLGHHGQRLYYSAPARENIGKASADEIRQILKEVKPMIDLGHTEDPSAMGSPANTTSFRGCAQGAFLLAGDAVAVTTPYGGQGMTLASEQARYLSEEFDFRTRSKILQVLSRRNYTQFAKRGYERVNLLNFGLYFLFFSRQHFYQTTTKFMVQTWQERPELAARVMRLFGGLDRNKPNMRELLDLWGINRVGPMIGSASEVLLRSAGDLLPERLRAA
jgi:2-polyprenyl-6-methoxyphenol hydroxylase-like FAD-dependent oxidoreductase